MAPPDLDVLLAAGGWVGAVGTITAYALVSTSRLAPTSRAFQGTNAVGASLLALSAASAGSWPSTAVNVLWAVIGLQALLVATWLRRRTRTAAPEPQPVPTLAPEPAWTPAPVRLSQPDPVEAPPTLELELCGVGSAAPSH